MRLRKWYIYIGLFVFAVTFTASISNNTLQTSLIRAGIGFALFSMIIYVAQYILLAMLVKDVSANSVSLKSIPKREGANESTNEYIFHEFETGSLNEKAGQ